MKTIPVALQSAYESRSLTVAIGLFFLRTDGRPFGFTSHDQSITLDVSAWWDGAAGSSSSSSDSPDPAAFVFDARQGLDASNIVTTAGLDVDNLDMTTLDDGTLFDRDEIFQRKWQNAKFWLFRYDYETATSTADVEVLIRGTVGETTISQNTIRVEMRGLAQKLQQSIGAVTSKQCRARLGDAKCTRDLTEFTHEFTITSVTDKRRFTCSAATQETDYFGEGLVTWQTGANESVTVKVAEFDGGEFTLVLPLWLDAEVGDVITAIAGCRKRLVEDCGTKFDNVINFQGEPHAPVADDLTSTPTPDV